MEVRNADGTLRKTAAEAAIEILKDFITQSGKLDDDVAGRLGGQPRHGRNTVLLDLVRYLTGPNPVPHAWLDAQRHGGFDLFEPKFYWSKSKRPGRVLGSPGVFLQRMLAQYRDNANNRRLPPAHNVALYAETALLTAVMIIRDLQKAVCAGSALGTAWVVNKAVDPLPAGIKRRIDALAADETYLKALSEAIAEVTAAHVTPDLPQRTNDQVHHSLPKGEDVTAYFFDRDARQVCEAANRLVETVEACAAGDGRLDGTGPVNGLVDRLLAAAKSLPDDPAALAVRVAKATRYLDAPVELVGEDIARHHERLRFLMPDLCGRRSPAERGAKLLHTANIYFLGDDYGSPRFADDPQFDAFFKAVTNRINSYVSDVGSPPPGTPMEHLIFFEMSANAIHTSGYMYWTAREHWRAAGLLPDDDVPSCNAASLVVPVVESGVKGVDVAAVLAAFRQVADPPNVRNV